MNGTATEQAKRYLNEKNLPQLFEALMTGLVYNKPSEPFEFIEGALNRIRSQPDVPIKWDMFVENPPPAGARESPVASLRVKSPSRPASVMVAASRAEIDDVPIILFIGMVTRMILRKGGPGGGKTRHAHRIYEAMKDRGLVYICIPELIKAGIAKYKDRYRDWAEASEQYDRGELISNQLVLALLKAEMGRHKDVKAYFLEGYPRDPDQITDFEREVKQVTMTIIIDYDEDILHEHMQQRGLSERVIQARINEFKNKTLPAAKYFDDKMLLHLIGGEQKDDDIFEQMKALVLSAMENGGTPPSDNQAKPKAVTAAPLPPPVAPQIPTSTVVEEVSKAQITTSETKVVSAQKIEEKPKVTAASAAAKTKTVPDETIQEKATTVVTTAATVHAKPKRDDTDDEDSESEVDVPTGLPNDAPVILIVGAPGSRKSHFCRKIAEKYDGFVYLSMGDLLREKVKKQPDERKWQRAKKQMDAGEPVSMKICRELLHLAIHGKTKSWGFVIEGYPRNIEQAQDFDETVERIDLVLLIDCTEHFCQASLKSRAPLSPRPDDVDVEAVRRRLASFKTLALPMLKYFDERGKLKVISGDEGIEEIFQEICNVIDTTLFIQDNGSGQSLESSKNAGSNKNDEQQDAVAV